MARQSFEKRASQAVVSARGIVDASAKLMEGGILKERRESAIQYVLTTIR